MVLPQKGGLRPPAQRKRAHSFRFLIFVIALSSLGDTSLYPTPIISPDASAVNTYQVYSNGHGVTSPCTLRTHHSLLTRFSTTELQKSPLKASAISYTTSHMV